jgi:Cu/Ag efflux protein CusF
MPFPSPRHLSIAWLGLVLATAAIAQDAARRPDPPAAEAQQQPVFTRARFVAAHEDAGKPYVRLTLLPRAKLPFSTQTFRLADRTLMEGIPDGSPVEFVARRIDGENTVVALRPMAECKRFQKC